MLDVILGNPILLALAALVGMAIAFGALLGFAAVRFEVEGNPLSDQINAILPQTQCGQCGYPDADPTPRRLPTVTPSTSVLPAVKTRFRRWPIYSTLNRSHGAEHGVEAEPTVAYIREDECIGCTKCIQACPVDAILGAAKLMHTVIIDECTGCDLCVEPCPVDCIDMIPRKGGIQHWYWPLPDGQTRENLIATDRSSEQAAA